MIGVFGSKIINHGLLQTRFNSVLNILQVPENGDFEACLPKRQRRQV
jgi:hypothetical protein